MRALCLSVVTAVVFAGCGSGASGGGTGGVPAASGGQMAHGGHTGTGGVAGASASGGSGTGGTIAASGGAGGRGGATSASGGVVGAGGGGSSGSGGVSGAGGTGGRGGAGGRAGEGGAGGSTGMACGGLLAQVCDADQFCDFGGTCGAGDHTGRCQPRQVGGGLCAPSPVCGCDGKTYPTACNAHQAGTDIMPTNACITGNGGTGAPCAGDTDCATGFKCCNTTGSVASAIACRQVAAGSQCPALP